MFDQFPELVSFEPVGVCHPTKAPRSIDRTPADALGTDVVDGDAHPGEGGEVVRRTTRGGEVEVEETDRFALYEDDIFEAYVVVADERTAFRVSQLVTPRSGTHPYPGRRLVELTE